MSNTPQPLSQKQPPRSHMTPFLESPRPWLVLARNMIPVLGIYLLGWSSDVIVFEIWFDGAASLGVMLAFQLKAFDLHDPDHFGAPTNVHPWLRNLWLVLPWAAAFLILGIPYWFTLLALHTDILRDGLGGIFQGSTGISRWHCSSSWPAKSWRSTNGTTI